MGTERRNFNRVPFGKGYSAKMMAIDATWQRNCRIADVSELGAKLTVDGSVSGLDTKEFFLVLSATGTAHRRCQRVWLNGDEIGVRFLRDQPTRAPPRRAWAETEPHADAHHAEAHHAEAHHADAHHAEAHHADAQHTHAQHGEAHHTSPHKSDPHG